MYKYVHCSFQKHIFLISNEQCISMCIVPFKSIFFNLQRTMYKYVHCSFQKHIFLISNEQCLSMCIVPFKSIFFKSPTNNV